MGRARDLLCRQDSRAAPLNFAFVAVSRQRSFFFEVFVVSGSETVVLGFGGWTEALLWGFEVAACLDEASASKSRSRSVAGCDAVVGHSGCRRHASRASSASAWDSVALFCFRSNWPKPTRIP